MKNLIEYSADPKPAIQCTCVNTPDLDVRSFLACLLHGGQANYMANEVLVSLAKHGLEGEAQVDQVNGELAKELINMASIEFGQRSIFPLPSRHRVPEALGPPFSLPRVVIGVGNGLVSSGDYILFMGDNVRTRGPLVVAIGNNVRAENLGQVVIDVAWLKSVVSSPRVGGPA